MQCELAAYIRGTVAREASLNCNSVNGVSAAVNVRDSLTAKALLKVSAAEAVGVVEAGSPTVHAHDGLPSESNAAASATMVS